MKVNDVLPLKGRVAAPNTFMSPGGTITSRTAVLLVVPGPLSVDEMDPVVLDLTPMVSAVKLTPTKQDAFAPTDPPLKLIDVEFAAAATVPPQVLTILAWVATARPAGNASVKLSPVSARLAFGLVISKDT